MRCRCLLGVRGFSHSPEPAELVEPAAMLAAGTPTLSEWGQMSGRRTPCGASDTDKINGVGT